MSNKYDSLGDRMKKYENVSRIYLMRRNPIIIRIDGKAFHSFTRKFQRPFDPVMIRTMQETMKYLCENIQGCVFGYTQSDEISLLLIDYQSIMTEGWFDNNLQKLVSVSASMATMKFNEKFINISMFESLKSIKESNIDIHDIYCEQIHHAIFDSRAFSIPKDEVCNYFIWRQQDATRNSIEMVGRYYFSHKQLYRKSCSDIQDMLMDIHHVNWNNYPTTCKQGSCCIKRSGESSKRPKWIIDDEIPIFSKDRSYIEKLI